MRFYLDHDVDAECGTVLRDAGHECWTASRAGNHDVADDDQTVHATEKDAVVVTHDREFTERRKKMPIGHHVRLLCHQMDGPELLERAHDELVAVLRASPDLVVELGPGRNGTLTTHLTFGSEKPG